MILTNYAECSIIETLDTNQTLGNESLLDGWHTCFIYFTICSIPTTLGTNETLGRKEKVQSVFIPTLGSDIRLGTYSSLPECYFLDTRTEGALGTNFSVPNVLFPRYNGTLGTNGLDSFGQVLPNFFVMHGSKSIQVGPSFVNFKLIW
jgi:hypothetical protein